MPAPELPPDLVGLSGLYTSPDPLLRRLRLEDSTGHPITDINKYFTGKQVVILYAGSEQGSNNLKRFHQNLTNLVLSRLKTLALVYVSTDLDASAAQRVLATQPWLRMTFPDSSDFASIGPPGSKEVDMQEVSRGEDFIEAGEIEMGVEKVEFGAEEYSNTYVRPLSRAAVTALINAYATPSVAIYHLESHSFLAKNVKPSAFTPANIEKNYHTWQNGGHPSLRLADVILAMKWPLTLAMLAVLYQLAIFFGGDSYNVLPRLIDAMNWRSRQIGNF